MLSTHIHMYLAWVRVCVCVAQQFRQRRRFELSLVQTMEESSSSVLQFYITHVLVRRLWLTQSILKLHTMLLVLSHTHSHALQQTTVQTDVSNTERESHTANDSRNESVGVSTKSMWVRERVSGIGDARSYLLRRSLAGVKSVSCYRALLEVSWALCSSCRSRCRCRPQFIVVSIVVV